MAGVRASIAKGSLWLGGARVLVNLASLLSTFVLARLLTPDDFGLVAIGTTLLTVVRAATDVAMAEALVQHSRTEDDHLHTAFTMNLLRGLLVGGLFAALGPFSAGFFEDARVEGVMLALGASLVVGGLVNPRRALMERDLVFWQEFVVSVAQSLATVVVSIAVALATGSYWALLAGTVAGQVAQVVASYLVVPYLPRLSLARFGELWSFSAWLTLSRVINQLNWNLDNLLIGKLLGRADLGHYTVGNTIGSLPTREATMPLSRTLFPAFSRLREEPERLRGAYQRAQALLLAVALPLGVGMALLARPLVLLVMGGKWLPAVIVIQVIAIVAALQVVNTISQALAMAMGDTRLIFARSIQMLVLRVPFMLAGIWLDGLRGLMLARIVTAAFGLLTSFHMVRQLSGLGMASQVRANARSVFAAGVMALVVIALRWLWPEAPPHQPLLLCAQLATWALAGGLAHVAAVALLWRMAGRPDGAESELLALARAGLAKVRR